MSHPSTNGTLITAAAPQPSPDATRPDLAELWKTLAEVPDPEIPVVSVVDLGIVRAVAWSEEDPDLCIVTVTPTYSGCPATEVIGRMIREALTAHGIARVRLDLRLAPAWTTDWLTPEAHDKLRQYCIAPPLGLAPLPGNSLKASLLVLGQGAPAPPLVCPLCGSHSTETISRFGSTPCKSLHRCLNCLEPFDHFKCH